MMRLRTQRLWVEAAVWTLLVALLSTGASTASETVRPLRPKIGLALGGGGARGLAHVGVLRWLERHRIPVDYIAGTSMGGLVGGAYASGMSAAEIQDLLRNVDWDLTFLRDVPYTYKNFRRKEDRRDYPVRLELGLRGGLSLPGSLESGHQVGLLLSRIALPYSTAETFDILPTPFRCVATDLETAELVVLGSGSLAQAMAATMAIPGVFPPVARDGQLLVDGGLLNNVPADVVRAMGADIVIAVDVGAPLRDRRDLTSALRQVSQAVDVMIHRNTRESLDRADIVVRPELGDVGIADWRAGEAIGERGYQAMWAHQANLSDLTLPEEAWSEHVGAREGRRRHPDRAPELLVVDGVAERTRAVVTGRLRHHLGKPLDLDRLGADLTALTGSGRYQSVRYGGIERDGKWGLRIVVTEKTYGPPFLNFSLDINNESQDVDFNFGSRLAAYDVGKPGAEVRADVALGSKLGMALEYYRPFGGTPWFLAPRASVRAESDDFFQDGELIANFQTRRGGIGVDIGRALGTRSELRLGFDVSRAELDLRIGDPLLPESAGKEEVARARWVFDGQDSGTIPSRGLRAALSLEWFLDAPEATSEFTRAEIQLSAFIPMRARHRLFLRAAGGTSFADSVPVLYQFTLGGPLRLGAFDRDEFRGDHFLLGAVGYLRTLGRLPDFAGESVYFSVFVESGSAFDVFDQAKVNTSVTAGLLMDTALGPIFLGGSVGDDGSSRIYFTVGRLSR